MAKQSRHPKAAQSNGSHTFSVGYGKPPAHTQFKPGQSGNPKGRRKGQRNVRTVVEEALNQRIRIREGDRTRSLTKLDGVILTMITGALKGDTKALASLIAVMRSLGMTGEPPAATDQKPFTADDDSLIADFLRRREAEIQATASEGKEEKKDATPSDRSTKS
jgi:Family of unknown function (DUF5681)